MLSPADRCCLTPCPQAWLGLSDVNPVALWLLFLGAGASMLLVHLQSWARCARQQGRQRQPLLAPAAEAAEPEAQLSRASSFDGIECPASLLGPGSPPSRIEAQASAAPMHTTLRVTASEALPAHDLWQPLALDAQPQWQLHDWLRFWLYRSAALGACVSGAPASLPAVRVAPASPIHAPMP